MLLGFWDDGTHVLLGTEVLIVGLLGGELSVGLLGLGIQAGVGDRSATGEEGNDESKGE